MKLDQTGEERINEMTAKASEAVSKVMDRIQTLIDSEVSSERILGWHLSNDMFAIRALISELNASK